MNKLDLINEIVTRTGVTETNAEMAVESILESINAALAKGDRVELRGFGSFKVRPRETGIGRHVVLRPKGGKPTVLELDSETSEQRANEGVESEVMEYANVLAHAVDTFGSRGNANAWLNRPNRIFANQTPLQILTGDPAAVEEELVRIDHGMFV